MWSVTKLYSYLNVSFGILGFIMVASIVAIICFTFGTRYAILDSNQLVINQVDVSRSNIREDLIGVLNELKDMKEYVKIISNRNDWIAEKLDTLTGTTVQSMSRASISLVHYVAEVSICSIRSESYKVKVDFYGINPRIEDSRLLILEDGFTLDGYDVYLPILDKNANSNEYNSANVCSIRIISSSNK